MLRLGISNVHFWIMGITFKNNSTGIRECYRTSYKCDKIRLI